MTGGHANIVDTCLHVLTLSSAQEDPFVAGITPLQSQTNGCNSGPTRSTQTAPRMGETTEHACQTLLRAKKQHLHVGSGRNSTNITDKAAKI